MIIAFATCCSCGVMSIAIVHIIKPHLEAGAGRKDQFLASRLATHIKGNRHHIQTPIIMIEYWVLNVVLDIFGCLGLDFYDAIGFSILLNVLEIGILTIIECLCHSGQ